MNTIIQAEIPQQLCAQAQLLTQGDVLQEVINEALRRYVESHEDSLSEAFIQDDVAWGLHGDD